MMFNNAHGFDTGASSDNTATYIIPRPGPGGAFTTILGGKYQTDNWDTSFSAADARGILDRCAALAPALPHPLFYPRLPAVGNKKK